MRARKNKEGLRVMLFTSESSASYITFYGMPRRTVVSSGLEIYRSVLWRVCQYLE